MTRTTNARVAGFTYLAYIALGLPAQILFDNASKAHGTAERLASIARHASDVRIAIVLSLLTCFAALVLAVALYGVTRDEDHEIAVLALSCRVGEGVLNAIGPLTMLGLLRLATTGDDAATSVLGGLLLEIGGYSPIICATFFSVGSTLFCWLLLRGRMIPVPLAWLGIVASVALVLALPLELVRILGGPIAWLVWLPMLVFEVVLGVWLLVKGVALPAGG